MTIPATGFIGLGGAYQDLSILMNCALGAVGRIAAFHTNSQILGHIFCDRQKLGDAAKGSAFVILIQTGHDHPVALIRQVVTNTYNGFIKKLRFIDGNNLSIFLKMGIDFGYFADRDRRSLHV